VLDKIVGPQSQSFHNLLALDGLGALFLMVRISWTFLTHFAIGKGGAVVRREMRESLREKERGGGRDHFLWSLQAL
jgi:hypothetical protein